MVAVDTLLKPSPVSGKASPWSILDHEGPTRATRQILRFPNDANFRRGQTPTDPRTVDITTVTQIVSLSLDNFQRHNYWACSVTNPARWSGISSAKRDILSRR